VYGLGATLREVAGDLLVPELPSLLTRMTGPANRRPQDMAEVARLLFGIAQRQGLQSAEMWRDQPPVETQKGVKRGLLSAFSSLFKGRASS
jgi:hypothetical protein